MKLIIFDLDGTLLNTLKDLQISINYATGCFGFSPRSEEEIRSFVGNGIKKAIERAVDFNATNNQLEKIVNAFKEYYKQHKEDNTKPYDGIIDMLKELKQRGYKLAILSNKYDKAVKELSKKYFGDLIDIAVGEGIGVEIKPSSTGVEKILKELKYDKEETIYIGDSEVDIQTAKNSGIKSISVLWGYKDRKFLEENGAEILAEKPKDIIKIIKNIEKKNSLE